MGMEGAPQEKKKGHPREKQMNRRDFLLALGVGASVIGANALRIKASKSTETPKVTKEGTDDSKEPTKPTT